MNTHSLQLFALLGTISGILSSIFRTGIIIGPGLFLLSGGELGLIITLVIVLYMLYKNYINLMEITIFIITYMVANYLMNIIKKIVL